MNPRAAAVGLPIVVWLGLGLGVGQGLDDANVEHGRGRVPASESPPGMVRVPGGAFLMGSEDGYPEEGPVREVAVDAFFIDAHEVTNREFAAFVAATGYRTVAERPPRPGDYPGADPALLVPGSAVFVPVAAGAGAAPAPDLEWWRYVPGASWRHPEGPGSTIDDRLDHPVVHVAYEDAWAYARFAGKTLPTEAQWERAARGSLAGARYAWGDDVRPAGRWMANAWQGDFPFRDTGEDGFAGTAPTGRFPPNGYGLVDVAGNVWEWTRSPFAADPAVRVAKGGSFLCAPGYCARFRPGARIALPEDTSTSHVGFRCVREASASARGR